MQVFGVGVARGHFQQGGCRHRWRGPRRAHLLCTTSGGAIRPANTGKNTGRPNRLYQDLAVASVRLPRGPAPGRTALQALLKSRCRPVLLRFWVALAGPPSAHTFLVAARMGLTLAPCAAWGVLLYWADLVSGFAKTPVSASASALFLEVSGEPVSAGLGDANYPRASTSCRRAPPETVETCQRCV